MNPKKVAKSYVCSWFFVDFISSFPFDYVSYASIGSQGISVPFAEASAAGQFLRITRLLGLLKLLRVTKILRYAVGWEDVSISLIMKWGGNKGTNSLAKKRCSPMP